MPSISNTDITLTQLRALVAVADAGGFTTAAQRLRLTQSGISQAIAALEAALTVPLVTRDRGGVTATDIGTTILSHAREILAHVEAMQQHAARAAGLEFGTLRIATVGSAAARLLPPMLRTFRRRHPAIEVILLEGTDQEVVTWVRSRVADIAFVAADAADISGLTARPVAADQLLLVVPAGHRLANRARATLAEVRGEPLLMSAGGCEPIIRGALDRAGVELPVRMIVRDIGTLIALVGEGFGVTLVPELAMPTSRGRVRALPLEPTVRRRLVAVTLPLPFTPVLSTFLDHVSAVKVRP
jgi:DNA-binding transcriptional LysR family regulator